MYSFAVRVFLWCQPLNLANVRGKNPPVFSAKQKCACFLENKITRVLDFVVCTPFPVFAVPKILLPLSAPQSPFTGQFFFMSMIHTKYHRLSNIWYGRKTMEKDLLLAGEGGAFEFWGPGLGFNSLIQLNISFCTQLPLSLL
jgi:hypothetical protein